MGFNVDAVFASPKFQSIVEQVTEGVPVKLTQNGNVQPETISDFRLAVGKGMEVTGIVAVETGDPQLSVTVTV